MHKTRLLLLNLLLILLVTSCAIKQEIHFNEDLSGTYKFTFDFSAIMEMAGKDSTITSEKELDESFNEISNSLKGLTGISDFKFNNDKEKGLVSFSYKFKDLDALNQSLTESSTIVDLTKGEKENTARFTKKGKKLLFSQPKSAISGEVSNEMGENFTYELVITFAKNIKRANINNSGKISSDKKSITQKGNIYTLFSNDTKWAVKFEK